MKLLFALSLSLVSSSLFAQSRVTRVFGPDEFLKDHVTAFLESGEVIHVPADHTMTIDQLKRSYHLGEAVSFENKTTSEEAAIVSELTTHPAPERNPEPNPIPLKNLLTDPLAQANITTLATYEAAQSVMNGMNGATSDDSQCYNRAHMWTYEALVNNRVNLGKLWIFFTRKYIREYRHKWWFHVTPYTEVGPERFRYALDRGFTMIPYTVENWKNIFIKSRANCPVVTRYRSYEDHQEDAHCYLIYSSQDYWQPWQLKRLDEQGVPTTGYKTADLRIAYRDALIRWNGEIPELPEGSPTPAPEPVPSQDLKVGDAVIYRPFLDRSVRVVKVSAAGLDIRYQDGRREIVRNVRREDLAVTTGCAGNHCVGERVINTALADEIVENKIIAITHDGLYVVRFEEGMRTGALSWGWHSSHIAFASGCANSGWCVGDVGYSRRLGAQVRVVGYESKGLVIEILSGPSVGWRVKYYRDPLTR